MSKLCRHTHFLIRFTVDPRLSERNGTDPCSDMQNGYAKNRHVDTAYTSCPISGTSSLTLCKMADLESNKS